MSIDYRALCAQLADELERCRPLAEVPDCLRRARAALAEPVVAPAWPTSQQLKTFACVWWKNFGFTKDKATCTWVIDEIDPEHFVNFSWDLLARYGHQPAPLAEGELLKEAAWLRNECSAENADGNWISMSIDQALDLASLLERQAALPLPITEAQP